MNSDDLVGLSRNGRASAIGQVSGRPEVSVRDECLGSANHGCSEAEHLAVGAEGACCAICSSPAAINVTAPEPARTLPSGARLPERLPPAALCHEHWSQYRSDWLLLGWCIDHYGEAVRHCSIHNRQIDPL